MKQKINRLTSYAERTETLMNYLFRKKRESIQKSLIRPLYQEALKCLFIVIIMLIDTLIPLEIFNDLPNIINIILALVFLCTFLYVEARIYNLLWGKNGRWSLEKYKKTIEETKEYTQTDLKPKPANENPSEPY